MPQPRLTWRTMTMLDLAAVCVIAARVHPDFPESPDVFAERLRLYPAGCLVLTADPANPDRPTLEESKSDTPLPDRTLHGYLISHPWLIDHPPSLDTLLASIPAEPSTYYIHDIALLPEARGCGAADAAVARLVTAAHAADSTNLSLVAVNGSSGFWQRQGFVAADAAALAMKLAGYGDDARYMVRWL